MKTELKIIFLIAVLVSLCIILTGCSSREVHSDSFESTINLNQKKFFENKKNTYDIYVEFNPETLTYSGEETILFYNKGETALNNIKLLTYANAFQDVETTPMPYNINKCFPKGFEEGYIEIVEIRSESGLLSFKDETHLITIRLPEPLPPGKTLKINIKFHGKIPRGATSFGSLEGSSVFYNWYPAAAVFENGKWRGDRRFYLGEPNYSEIADYKLTVKIPNDLSVIGPGKKVEERLLNMEQKIITFKADNIRDLVWVAGQYDHKSKVTDKGVVIESFYTKKNRIVGERILNMSEDIIDYYSKKIGDYPFEKLVIVETNIINSGMEFPQIICLSEKNYDFGRISVLGGVIAHEIAHQWWYAAVGNDQYWEPWLDEAFATYWAKLFGESIYGAEYMRKSVEDFRKREVKGKAVNFPVFKFGSYDCYQATVYYKGALLLHNLRENIGMNKFHKIFQEYYKSYRNKNAHGEDFINIIGRVAGKEAAEKFKKSLVEINYDDNIKTTFNDSKGALSHFYNKIKRDEQVVIVYGTSGNRWNKTIMKGEAVRLKGLYSDLASTVKDNTAANIKVAADNSVSVDMIKHSNVVVLGNPDTNSFYSKIMNKIPVLHSDKTLIIQQKRYMHHDLLYSIVLPSPFDRKKYLVIYGGNNPSLITEIHRFPIQKYDYTVVFYPSGFRGGYLKTE